jgi:putative endopeptidase
VNFGAVGSVIGHELGHSIDDQGSQFDDHGRLKAWLTKEDGVRFHEKTNRLISIFGNLGVNGDLTQGENIGDLVGLTFSYGAAFPDGKGTPEEKRAFFTQWARNWCGVIRPGELQRRLKVDPHSPGFLRASGQVMLQPGFQEAFGCKLGDPMVLPEEERVKIW